MHGLNTSGAGTVPCSSTQGAKGLRGALAQEGVFRAATAEQLLSSLLKERLAGKSYDPMTASQAREAGRRAGGPAGRRAGGPARWSG